jgi:hypothetical protein
MRKGSIRVVVGSGQNENRQATTFAFHAAGLDPAHENAAGCKPALPGGKAAHEGGGG